MDDLKKYFNNNPGKLINKWDNYFPIYEKHFSRFRGQAVSLLEIGVCHGGSLQMWKHYFGTGANIYGVDIHPRTLEYQEEQINIFIGDQEERHFLRSLLQLIPSVDIIIDDDIIYTLLNNKFITLMSNRLVWLISLRHIAYNH